MAQGRLTDIVAFETRGWELVVSNLHEQARAALASRVQTITPLSGGRYTLELLPTQPPEALIQDLTQQGVHIVSLNPIRTTLEDYFVSSIGAAAPRDTAFLKER